MRYKLNPFLMGLVYFCAWPASAGQYGLEEVIVTAQKREQSLQDAPIAISAMGSAQLEAQGITNLQSLGGGAIPALRIQPFPNSPTTLTPSIRGDGPADIGQITRESSVAVYLDGIYLSRAQSLSMEVADLERIEVLRGPQGTLFGRNAVGGAINMITKKPTGELSFEQRLGVGSYDGRTALSRLNLPEVGGLRVKLDYLHDQRDGWVKNTAPGEDDYNQYNNDGGRLAAVYAPIDNVSIEYAYENSVTRATQNYFQLYIDNGGLVGEERDRETTVRAPAVYLRPTVTKQQGHSLIVSYEQSPDITWKSLTARRTLTEDTFANYGAAIYYNGLQVSADINQKQFSQEFQFIGNTERWKTVAGVYYFYETADEHLQNRFGLDTFGFIPGNSPNTPIYPPTTFDLFTGAVAPPRDTSASSKSYAGYGQTTWTPPFLEDRLEVTMGLRYTKDAKSGKRTENGMARFRMHSDHIDPAITFNYRWNDEVSTYLRWSTAYKAGGANTRSKDFTAYKPQDSRSWEAGSKFQFLDNRARLNLAIFRTINAHSQIDFSDPTNTSLSETINAAHSVEIEGGELDAAFTPFPNLVFGLSYAYLNYDMPDQPNAVAGGRLEPFEVTQAPRHAGAFTADYSFPIEGIGTIQLHADVTSTSSYAYAAKDFQRRDSYTLLNARVSLADIALGGKNRLKVSVWGKNLTDQEYIIYAYPVGDPLLAVDQAFGDPRTCGIEVTYNFN